MKDDESEGDDQVEEEPHIYHLDVGRGGEILPNLNILGIVDHHHHTAKAIMYLR